ncbi:MAG: EutP/PduV family microcompartment system protein [Lysinibacillus sp.]
MNKVMIIGAIGAGKSTLTKALLNKEEKAVKTQALQYEGWIVDTPGEYLENPLFYKNIMATSFEVTHLIYLQDATRIHSNFPPFFGTGIAKLPIGVVTKVDLEEANVAQSVQHLRQVIGRAPIVITSAVEKRGLAHIVELVSCNSMAEMEQYVLTVNDDDVFMA